MLWTRILHREAIPTLVWSEFYLWQIYSTEAKICSVQGLYTEKLFYTSLVWVLPLTEILNRRQNMLCTRIVHRVAIGSLVVWFEFYLWESPNDLPVFPGHAWGWHCQPSLLSPSLGVDVCRIFLRVSRSWEHNVGHYCSFVSMVTC